MMGRYNLANQGLVYGHSGNKGLDQSKYKTFPAAQMPLSIMEGDWFHGNAGKSGNGIYWSNVATRNLEKISNSSLRDWLIMGSNPGYDPSLPCHRFYNQPPLHVQRRPIYWLFSSGKLRVFQCLVYLHRYTRALYPGCGRSMYSFAGKMLPASIKLAKRHS